MGRTHRQEQPSMPAERYAVLSGPSSRLPGRTVVLPRSSKRLSWDDTFATETLQTLAQRYFRNRDPRIASQEALSCCRDPPVACREALSHCRDSPNAYREIHSRCRFSFSSQQDCRLMRPRNLPWVPLWIVGLTNALCTVRRVNRAAFGRHISLQSFFQDFGCYVPVSKCVCIKSCIKKMYTNSYTYQ